MFWPRNYSATWNETCLWKHCAHLTLFFPYLSSEKHDMGTIIHWVRWLSGDLGLGILQFLGGLRAIISTRRNICKVQLCYFSSCFVNLYRFIGHFEILLKHDPLLIKCTFLSTYIFTQFPRADLPSETTWNLRTLRLDYWTGWSLQPSTLKELVSSY